MQITATADHPFLTPIGMVPLREVKDLPVAIYPFRGVDYEGPPGFSVVTADDLLRFLKRAQRPQIIEALTKRNLLPLTPRNPAFPYLLKVFGLALGDGHASLNLPAPHVAFWGKREDLEDVRKDVARLGFRPSRVYVRTRHHKILLGRRRHEFVHEEAWFRANSSALTALLHAMGLPVGNKSEQDVGLPV